MSFILPSLCHISAIHEGRSTLKGYFVSQKASHRLCCRTAHRAQWISEDMTKTAQPHVTSVFRYCVAWTLASEWLASIKICYTITKTPSFQTQSLASYVKGNGIEFQITEHFPWFYWSVLIWGQYIYIYIYICVCVCARARARAWFGNAL
jgi:hypothetical protein